MGGCEVVKIEKSSVKLFIIKAWRGSDIFFLFLPQRDSRNDLSHRFNSPTFRIKSMSSVVIPDFWLPHPLRTGRSVLKSLQIGLARRDDGCIPGWWEGDVYMEEGSDRPCLRFYLCKLITWISRASVAVNIDSGHKSVKVEWNLIGARILQMDVKQCQLARANYKCDGLFWSEGRAHEKWQQKHRSENLLCLVLLN